MQAKEAPCSLNFTHSSPASACATTTEHDPSKRHEQR